VPADYEILTAPLDERHGHVQARAMLGQLDRAGWQMVGEPIVYTDTDGVPSMCVVLRREASSPIT
jgi:hypothetical protein